MCPKQIPKQEVPPEPGNMFKPVLSMKETQAAIGLGHVATSDEAISGRLKTFKYGRRRFSTPEWVLEWIADRAAESEQAQEAK